MLNRRHLLQLCVASLSCACTQSMAQWARKPMTNPQTISAEAAYQKMQQGGVHIIDVREPHEFESGHVPGAFNWPLSQLERGEIPALCRDKNATYLIYCRSGRRSAYAAGILAQNGWTSLFDFGGILNWPYAIER